MNQIGATFKGSRSGIDLGVNKASRLKSSVILGKFYDILVEKWFEFPCSSKIPWLYENVHIKLFAFIKLHLKRHLYLQVTHYKSGESYDAWRNSNNKWDRKAIWCLKCSMGWLTLERPIFSNTPLLAIPIGRLGPEYHRKALESLGTKTSPEGNTALIQAQTQRQLARFHLRLE